VPDPGIKECDKKGSNHRGQKNFPAKTTKGARFRGKNSPYILTEKGNTKKKNLESLGKKGGSQDHVSIADSRSPIEKL